ncbi:sulfotransferase family protein [Leptolyngbya sp. 7M]|uniref:sulfotransferase family protein n=1 Tax=Leptolyngbya sp. 7M TaxID=2812896 RepID=UPI001B8DA8C5|nr:sulfotransferase [Leptolyngbya sp. 7M]QYO62225.1 sulfotransferase [Leptolyngbya sp. 7M]
MPKPNFFIIGLPRCGTTSLSYYLRSHPDVFFPEPLFKEPHFFSPDVYPQQIKTEAEYLKIFERANNAKRIGEASVFYIFSDFARENIQRFNPEAKIIIIIRQPVEFMISLHQKRNSTNCERSDRGR